MHRTLLALAATIVGLSTASLPATTHAADWAGAVDHCQGSLPSFEGALRKRPLGIANEGSTTAFIGCSMRMDTNKRAADVTVVFINRSAGPMTVNCTLVSGMALPFPFYPPVYVSKSREITGVNYGGLTWTIEDNGGSTYRLPNLNCQLPPGVEINAIQVTSVDAA